MSTEGREDDEGAPEVPKRPTEAAEHAEEGREATEPASAISEPAHGTRKDVPVAPEDNDLWQKEEEPPQDRTARAPEARGSPTDPALTRARDRQMLRMGFGTAASFTLAEALNWELSFLISVLVVQLLVTMPGSPSVAQGLGAMAVFGATTCLALVTSQVLAHMPVLLTIVLATVLFVAFYLQTSGRAGLVATLLLVSFGIVPLASVQAPDIAPAIAFYIFRSGIVAVLWVWIAFALFPTALASAAQAPAAPLDQREIVRRAAIDTAILLPVLVFAMTLAVPAVVLIVLTVTAMLRQHSLASGRRVALVLLLGNLLGGVAAVVAYNLLSAAPTIGFLASLLLLIGLLFGQQIARGGACAPLFVTGLVTFLIVFGTGVAPLFDEPGATLTQRLFNIGLACTYAFLALALLDIAMRRERPTALPSIASAVASIREPQENPD
jgi:Protein of unknown function (DUF2955)